MTSHDRPPLQWLKSVVDLRQEDMEEVSKNSIRINNINYKVNHAICWEIIDKIEIKTKTSEEILVIFWEKIKKKMQQVLFYNVLK